METNMHLKDLIQLHGLVRQMMVVMMKLQHVMMTQLVIQVMKVTVYIMIVLVSVAVTHLKMYVEFVMGITLHVLLM